MTPEEKIDKIYYTVIKLEPLVKEHHNTLYGNGQPGLSKDVLVLKQRQNDCPARLAVSSDNKRLGIATVLMVIAVIGLIASTAFGVLNYLK